MPSVSVHIVTHNSESMLPLCLESLRHQDNQDYQVIIFDNASVDNTRQIAQTARIRVIESETNVGYAQAHNALIDQTTSSYVLTLNPDVYLYPDFLGVLEQTLAADPTLGSAAGCLLRVDQLGETSNRIDSAGLGMSRSCRQRLLREGTDAATTATLQPIFGPDGAAAFYRRAMLEDIRIGDEVFDPDFFMHKEDVDICWRAQLRGWSSVYVPGAKAYHVRSFRPGQRHRVSPDLRMLAVRNRYLVSLKNEIPVHFMRDLPFILLYDVGVVTYLLLRERELLQAYRSIWQLRGRMLQKRRMIQSQRRVGVSTIARWFSA